MIICYFYNKELFPVQGSKMFVYLGNFFFSFSFGSKIHSTAAADRALVKLHTLFSMYMFSYQYCV